MKTIQLDCMNWPETQTLIQAMVRGGIDFKFVGGCVRDALLGQANPDIDIATSALPDTVMARLHDAGIRTIPTGIEHGTVTALVEERQYEITTLRKDIATDGRHAVVLFTDDWKEDAARRDFTMNAIYADAKGNITDYFGGVEDTKNGLVRFIGDAQTRIKEDALRILRFFRFSARLARGDLDADGLAACTTSSAMLAGLSGERIQTEMLKLLIAERAGEMLEVMQTHSILEYIFHAPVRPVNITLLRNLESHLKETRSAVLTLALLLRSAGLDKEAVFKFVCARWKLSGAYKKTLQQLLTAIPTNLSEVQAKAHIRRIGAEIFIQHMLLSGAEEKVPPKTIKPLLELARKWLPPSFPVSGDDLLARGFKSGAALGDALGRLEAAWEKSGYALSKEELLGQL